MNNVKLRGRTVMVAGLKVRGLRYARKPKHTPRELMDIKTMSTEDLKRRSRNRAASKVARHARRITRHDR